MLVSGKTFYFTLLSLALCKLEMGYEVTVGTSPSPPLVSVFLLFALTFSK
jgi:hypothetical protein